MLGDPWGSGKGHLGNQTLSSQNSNNVAGLRQEGSKYFASLKMSVTKHGYFNSHFGGKLSKADRKKVICLWSHMIMSPGLEARHVRLKMESWTQSTLVSGPLRSPFLGPRAKACRTQPASSLAPGSLLLFLSELWQLTLSHSPQT